jgi:hypothetical protein
MRRILIAVALFGCGPPAAAPVEGNGLVFVTGASPLTAGCTAAQPGTLYTGAEVEPSVAVDPTNPQHLVGAWQQDRFSNGGAAALLSAYSFDGGHGWTRSTAAFTLCTGGVWQRGSDPWVSIAADGTVHQAGFGFNESNPGKAMLAVRSTDGGRSWSDPIALMTDSSGDFALDKETITADPNDAHYVYAVWDRLTGQANPNSPANRGPTWFARSTDNGVSWETARMIYDPGADAQTIANQIAVLPGGGLLNLMTVITQNSSKTPQPSVAVLLSNDRGQTWSAPVAIAQAEFVGTVDPKNGQPVRSGDLVPSIAIDPASGTAYVAWEDARFSGEQRDDIALSRSIDGGNTWSLPVQVNGMPAVQAFTPAVAFANGVLAVSYYDLRDDTGAAGQLLASHWLATSSDFGATFTDARMSEPFDLQSAPVADGYFLGDYQGLTHAGGAFLPFFVIANSGNSGNRTDVVFRPADAAPLDASPSLAQRARRLWVKMGAVRERWRFGTTRKQ